MQYVLLFRYGWEESCLAYPQIILVRHVHVNLAQLIETLHIYAGTEVRTPVNSSH